MPEDDDIERINKKKLEEILARKSEPSPIVKPMVLTDENFTSEVSRHHVMVVDFWAPWCGPCKMVGPIIEELAIEYAGKVSFGKLNVDENPKISGMFRVQSIPTILLFNNGKAVDGLVGAVPKSYIESKIRPYLSGKESEPYG
ncbi:MAG: thioredoxin [Nitrososphaerales archaeon]